MIRRAEESDLGAVLTVHCASIRTLCAGHYTPEQLAEWTAMQSIARYAALRATRIMWVACDDAPDAKIVGFGVVSPTEGVLNAIYVAPSVNGRGVGRELVVACETAARETGCARLELNATPNAIGFYQRLGYQARGTAVHTLPSGQTLACTRMAKALSSK